MATKSTIVGVLGEKELLLPELLHEALAANGRVKYFFSLLQLARSHADGVGFDVPDLSTERQLAGIDDADLDRVIRESRQGRDDDYRVPRSRCIVDRLLSDVDKMIVPLRAAGPDRVDAQSTADFDRRLAALRARCRPESDGTLSGDAISRLTSSDRERADSAHLLVVDLHKAVDVLEASLATDEIDGAKAYGLSATDRPLVAAFVRGVHDTEALKFGHPGLGTMATRSGPTLIIENDIGETTAHVVVIHVDGLRVVVTNTDVHVQRLEFFQSLLQPFPVEWADTRSRSAREFESVGLFYECVGTFEARDQEELERFLSHLGSRLVFLIDWNRARKTLREFVRKEASIDLLSWAASNHVGHRGLLEMGGARMIFDAMAAVIRTPLRFGERLDDVLGDEAAASFLRFVLRASSEGLRDGRSPSLIRAEIRAELARGFHACGERLLGPISRHAEIVAEMAKALRDQLRGTLAVGGGDLRAMAHEAKEREHRADDVVLLLRAAVARMPDADDYRRIIERADDAADGLEEAAFLLSRVPPEWSPTLRRGLLEAMGDILVQATDAYLASVLSARRIDVNQVLDAVDTVVGLEHEMDDAERNVIGWLVGEEAVGGKVFVLTSRIAAQIEDAVDALTHAALLLRERMTVAAA